MMKILNELARCQIVRELDVHFGELMARLHGTEAPEIAVAAALASAASGKGDVCLPLPTVADVSLGGNGNDAVWQAPPIGTWIEALASSPVVGPPGDFRPLILDAHGRLYLYRYWDYEQRMAADLIRRAQCPPLAVDDVVLRDGLARLFPASGSADITDWQRVAVAMALTRRLCVISGGPGTGKTTTVVRLLALLVECTGLTGARVALAAPTGKAAARLEEAIRSAKARLPVNADVRERIPEHATTVHRLLGSLPGSVDFRHHRDNPLAVDLLVVDEASMVDLALMAKLLEALPDEARLVLLGDKDQLASVESGAVLGDVCAGAAHVTPGLAERLRALTGESPPSSSGVAPALADSIVFLERTHRFGAESGIGVLARAVNAGDVPSVFAALRDGAYSDVRWTRPASVEEAHWRVGERAVAEWQAYFQGLEAGADTAELLRLYAPFRVLCAHREGPFGATALNRVIEQALRRERPIRVRDQWYSGRPVMITRNDYNLRLFNGDIGITVARPGHPGEYVVMFPAPDGGVREIRPLRLPEHETVYAMTTHKSQGSEFERVLFVLPQEPSPVLSRELIYTAITRAAASVEICGQEGVIAHAVSHRIERSSGLRERLWG